MKRTFMHVLGLPRHIFIKKSFYEVFGFFYQNMEGEDLRHAKTWVSGPQTHAYACLRSSPTIFWFKETKYYINCYFLIEIWLAKIWDKHKLMFQALKRTFMHVSCLPPSMIWRKTKFFLNSFFLYQNMVGEVLRHAQTCVSEPETHFYTCIRSSPTIFWFKKQMYKVFGFSSKYAWGEDLRHAETCVSGPKTLVYACLSSSPTIFPLKNNNL